MSKIIPLDEPVFNGNEKKYVSDCFKKGWISWQGEFVKKFEKKFSSFVNNKYGISTANGTDALIIALKALSIKQGDEVIVPSLTFSASVFAISEVGAQPVFVDNLENSFEVDVDDIRQKINKKTKAIMAVHLYGRPVEIDKIKNLAKRYKLFLIEDCAECLGSKYKNKKTGSFGDISCFSFHNKLIATGEGGMITTNKKKIFEKIKLIRNPAPDNRTNFKEISLNSRMSNINAALGLAQLERITKIISQKRHIARLYSNFLKNVKGVEVYKEKKNSFCTYWRHSIKLEQINKRDQLQKYLIRNKIISRGVFSPMHLHPLYKRKKLKLKNSERVSKCSLDVPSSVNLNEKKIKFITNCIKKFLKNAN